MLQPFAATPKTELLPPMEEYVIVPQPNEIRDNNVSIGGRNGSEMNDDDSYDYCDDAFSQGEPFADSDDDDNSVASRSCDNKDSIIISVPSGLMKDLDEAHAAAALARVSDVSELIDSPSVSTKDTPVQEPEESDDVSIQKTIADNTKPLEASTSDARAEAKATAEDAIAANNLSRASNKKRRKKLKLMKKAQAAANAAEALATRTAAMSKMHHPKKIIPATTSRTTSRKVANIAVACARETMASYRQEVLCSSLS